MSEEIPAATIPSHRHQVTLRSGEPQVIEADTVVGMVVDEPLAGTGEAFQLPGALDADGRPPEPVRRGRREAPSA